MHKNCNWLFIVIYVFIVFHLFYVLTLISCPCCVECECELLECRILSPIRVVIDCLLSFMCLLFSFILCSYILLSMLCVMCVWTFRVPYAHPLGMLTHFFLFVSHQACLGYIYWLWASPYLVTAQFVHHCTILYHLFTWNIISYSSEQPSTLCRGTS